KRGVINSIAKEIAGAKQEKSSDGKEPVKYLFVTDDPGRAMEIESVLGDKGVVVNVAAGADVINSARGRLPDISSISWMSIATNDSEAGIGAVLSHYNNPNNKGNDNRINSLITSTTLGEDDQAKIPAAALLTILIKLASQGQTTVMTVGCRQKTVDALTTALMGGFRLLRLAKLQIDRLVSEFFASLHVTARSL
ncbi:MAG: hypothetical protein NTY34_00135, partial [Candidatus Omnitrophica bacterium]|nr:hypothetical protein [Candidatus Omnitrophota bacterium]